MALRRIPDLFVRKVLGINVTERYIAMPTDMDKQATDILDSADIYVEDEPSVAEWFKELAPSRRGAIEYVTSLFPSASWIQRYNPQWLAGDMVAGITIGLVVVPQALAYAALADLTPPYGLYTSFTGAVLYWIFGTSKDIVIGTTAVGSLLVGQVVNRVTLTTGDYTNEQVAHCLSMMSGAILLFLGLVRLGWVVEFIPYIPISAFVTAASITIMSTQIPTALGLPGVNTRDPPYKVIIQTFKLLPQTRLDAAIGLSSIALLFGIRGICTQMEQRQPKRRRMWSFISSLRLTFTMLLYTLISYLANRSTAEGNAKFRIVGHIERGFQRAGVPRIEMNLVKQVLPELPAVAIILVIEHIAIAKAMGRLYNYTVNPSQEVVALGAANILSPFVGGYVCTGSFGASAVLSKAGVRTPLAGLFSAGVLILALYALTGVFYYIPKAALAGLIIHAVCNLLTPPRSLYKYWQLSPVEFLIWVVGVALAIFVSLEASIYAGAALSIVLVLVRLARTRGTFLGVVKVKRISAGKQNRPDQGNSACDKTCHAAPDAFIPLDRSGPINPDIKLESPYPGVFIYQLHEGFNYTNQAYHIDILAKYIEQNTQRLSDEGYEKESDRLWNDAGGRTRRPNSHLLPYLRAIVLDFGAVNHVDITSVQGLIDLRNQLDNYSAPDTVEWHFANVHNRWTRRALGVAGFGYPTAENPEAVRNWRPIYSIAATLSEKEGPFGDENRCVTDTDTDEERTRGTITAVAGYAKRPGRWEGSSRADNPRMAAIHGVNRPFFHGDLYSAVECAVTDAQSKNSSAIV
ncbi:sulfate permease 2 [Metarhizium robertsii ARSEF 23]|uniref:Sulfate permease 2 n=1 Tax=Metarhizium robertsii (strain ARSEF 23 / ATCC MYA-3075) TaxID=655844 RepID=E9F274_METRA|nr:sulfate permease 2 [Metarhizium robertsii ARSEF 23]EFY98163.2 sulfate permease 2 [Metarhizium robertsii ARSEF 23]